MSDEFKACLVIAAGMLAFFTLGFVSGYASGRTFREELPPVVEVDTLVTRDTVYVDSPVPEAEIPAGYTIVPLGSLKEMKAKLALLESAAPDTVLVSLPVPVTERTYKGDDYEAVVSGYEPKLERISVFPKTTTITRVETVTKTTVPPWTVSPFLSADIGCETFAARAGILGDLRLKKDLHVFLGGGYEVRNDVTFRTGWFATGGVSWQLHP